MPPGSFALQLPCLSLMCLQTKTRSRTQFDREEKFIPAFTEVWNIVCFRCIGYPFFFVTCGDCYSSSCLTSEDRFKHQSLDSSEIEHIKNNKQKQWVLCGWEAQAPQLCVIDLVSLKALRLLRTWNWIAECGPAGILITLCQYCSKPLTNWRDWSRQPLIKTSAYHCDSTLFPGYGSDWFCSQVSQWAEPRASAP